jgi:hypothetical protein
MATPADPQRLAQAHQLTVELRRLQHQMNRTVEQLCDLVGGHAFQGVLPGPADHGGAAVAEAAFSPSFLQLPRQQAFERNAPTGLVLGPDAIFYTDNATGLLNIVQQPLQHSADSRYSLILNFAGFDGEWMSLALNARSLLAGLPSGRAQVGLVIESTGSPQTTLRAKCSWAGADWREERPLDVYINQLSTATAEIDYLDTQKTQALDVHLVFNPPPRGSVEIRRITVTVVVQAAPTGTRSLFSVFDSSR